MADLATLTRLRADRCRRERHFPGLPDAAFDMLVDLALNAAQGRRVSVTSACLAGFVPATTGLRHIALLVGDGLVERIPDDNDRRRVWIKLTDAGALAISGFLASPSGRVAGSGTNVAPAYSIDGLPHNAADVS